jgi:hypothetical protein
VPQFRPRAMLEQSAAADVAKNTLSRIPTLFGRLIYLASLRDSNSGVYRHYGLYSIFGREESRLALSQHHRIVFREWLALPLEAKHQDLSAYLDALEDPRELVLEHWTKVRSYRSYIPASARRSERALFFSELEVLMETLRCADSARASRA